MSGPRTFDPDAVGTLETDAWASYYRHEWRPFLRAAFGMVREGFGMDRRRTLYGAYLVLRANQKWSPCPDNHPDAARALMRRFYALVARHWNVYTLDPARAAELEVEWWRLHREHQYGVVEGEEPLVEALVDLYSYVYDAPRHCVVDAARHRVRAMQLSDDWVSGGRSREDPRLAEERAALMSSYRALRDAVLQDRSHN